jgi:curved DNA-binding protein CbpA
LDLRERILTTLDELDSRSYYELLRIRPGANRDTLQLAFHRFALTYHPDRHLGDEPDIRDAVKRIFERGVEAYTVLRNPEATKVYNSYLAKGQLRLPTVEFERLAARKWHKVPTEPPPKTSSAKRWVEAIRTSDGKEVAYRVTQLMVAERYREAMQQLAVLESLEPDNPAVKDQQDTLAKLIKKS